MQLARKQEAEKRRKEQQQAEKAAKAQEEFYTNSSLFAAPTRDHSGDNTVAQVLGEFKGAQHMLTDKNNLIGVDYAPPTPAPAQHIIGKGCLKKIGTIHYLFFLIRLNNKNFVKLEAQ